MLDNVDSYRYLSNGHLTVPGVVDGGEYTLTLVRHACPLLSPLRDVLQVLFWGRHTLYTRTCFFFILPCCGFGGGLKRDRLIYQKQSAYSVLKVAFMSRLLQGFLVFLVFLMTATYVTSIQKSIIF